MSAKTAILISGAMRGFDQCLANLHWFVFKHYTDASFYVSTVTDEDASKAELLRKKYPKARIEIDYQAAQPKIELPGGCPPESSFVHGRPFMHEPYFISVPPQAILGQLWQLKNVWNLFQAYGESVDTIIRCRPDLWFLSMDFPKKVISGHEKDITVEDRFPKWKDVWTPWWGRFGGVNDRFAIMHSQAAPHYFGALDNAQRLVEEGCPLHPESLVNASLTWNGCRVIDTLRAEFMTHRKDGQHRSPEISAIDIAHLRSES